MFDFSKCNDMSRCFENCYSMDFSNLHLICSSNIISMTRTFKGCRFKYFEDPLFDTSNVAYFNECFYECVDAVVINVSSFNLKSCVNDACMFGHCVQLVRIIVNTKIFRHEISYCNSNYMMAVCLSLKYFGDENSNFVDMSNFNAPLNSPYMFQESSSMRKLIIKSDCNLISLYEFVFKCRNLTYLEMNVRSIATHLTLWIVSSLKIQNVILKCDDCLPRVIAEYYVLDNRYTNIDVKNVRGNTEEISYIGSEYIVHVTNPLLECKFINKTLKSLII